MLTDKAGVRTGYYQSSTPTTAAEEGEGKKRRRRNTGRKAGSLFVCRPKPPSPRIMKSRGKSRLLCFRPLCQEDGVEDSKIKPVGKTKSIPDPVFTYISVSTSDIGISEDAVDSRKGEIVVEGRRRIACRILARVLGLKIAKSQSDTTTVKHRKLRQDAIAEIEKNATAVKAAPQQQPCHKSLEGEAGKTKAVSSGSSTSLSSSVRKNSVASHSDESTARRRTESGAENPNCFAALYLLVISLSVLVLWGRLCAILWTSTCLYFVIRWKKKDDRLASADIPATAQKAPEMDGSEYRKRVIMEGLLGRNHHRV
ncbi:hypothetical protein ACLOJK_039759 [Asimina triloba]